MLRIWPMPRFGLSVATWAGLIGYAETLSLEVAADCFTSMVPHCAPNTLALTTPPPLRHPPLNWSEFLEFPDQNFRNPQELPTLSRDEHKILCRTALRDAAPIRRNA